MAARAASQLMRHARGGIAASQNLVAHPGMREGVNRGFAVVPDEYGQPKSGGTDFLGTPKNHKELLEKRPMSPHLFGLDNKPHYKFPPGALSSITIRVTGVAQTGGLAMLSWMALTGDAVGSIDWFANSFLGYPMKACVTFPFAYHYLGACRHFVWDSTAKYLDQESVDKSSYGLFAGAGAVSFISMFL